MFRHLAVKIMNDTFMPSTIKHIKPDLSKLPGGYEPKSVPIISGNSDMSKFHLIKDYRGLAFVIENALTVESCNALINFFQSAPEAAPVSVTGYMDGDSTAKYGGLAGSVRTTMWAEKLSNQLWDIIKSNFSSRHMLNTTSTDWWQEGKHRNWSPVGLTPMMRFMRYDKSGEHYAHYDAGYLYPDGKHHTLMSYVVYLTTNNSGGTRFIRDNQDNLPIWDRKHDDWTRRADADDVEFCYRPTKGSILVFDHRLCHDVEQFMPDRADETRIIIRGDVVYAKTDQV